MRLFPIICSNRGVAIVAVTMVMVVVALLGGAIITQTTHNAQLSNRTFTDKQALYLAESAKERGYQEILDDDNFTSVGNPGVLANVNLPGGSYALTATTLSVDPKVVQLVAVGTPDAGSPADTRQITVVAEVVRENVSVWNNAIFGGAGQTGGVINGNCAIHGSVHLLGDGVGEGNNSIEALDLSGASLIHNNYVGMPAELLARVPALPTTVFGGETISTIDAKLRVKNGAVGVSGSSEIGEANIVGNAFKETMNGIYIETDSAETRWTGNQVVDGVPNPGSVQSDNGTDALYDLGDVITMPDMTAEYTDPATSITYGSYGAYFDANSLTLPPLTLDNSTDAAVAIQQYEANGLFSAGVVVNVDVVTGIFVVTDPTGNTIAYNPDGGAGQAVLVVNGMVKMDGDLVIGEKNHHTLYAGKGTIYAAGDGSDGSGDIEVHSNLLSVGTFPSIAVLGLMAKNDINLATGPGDSQLIMTAAFFAGHEIVSTKQNQIAGTFVSTSFDMGLNVPKIYQVPTLKDNLPPGLIGSEPIWVTTGFQERSWQIN